MNNDKNQTFRTDNKNPSSDRTMSEASMRGVDRDKIDEKEDILESIGEEETSEKEKSRPYVVGEQSASGSTPDPEEVHRRNVLERAQKTGMYTEAEEGRPEEVDIAEEVDESEKALRERN